MCILNAELLFRGSYRAANECDDPEAIDFPVSRTHQGRASTFSLPKLETSNFSQNCMHTIIHTYLHTYLHTYVQQDLSG